MIEESIPGEDKLHDELELLFFEIAKVHLWIDLKQILSEQTAVKLKQPLWKDEEAVLLVGRIARFKSYLIYIGKKANEREDDINDADFLLRAELGVNHLMNSVV